MVTDVPQGSLTGKVLFGQLPPTSPARETMM
jgi:hypothetical protein